MTAFIAVAVFVIVAGCALGWAYLAMEAAEAGWRTPTYHARRYTPEVMEPPIYFVPPPPSIHCFAPDEDDVDLDDDWDD